jgi:hypothetical protein
MAMDAKQTGRCRRILLAGVAVAVLGSPMSVGVVRAGDTDDGFAALAVLMGVGVEAVAAKVRTQDKAFIDQCTDAAIEKWRARDISVGSLHEGQKLEDECVLEAVAMEVARMRAEADAESAATAARIAEAEAISDRVAASHRQVVAASGPVAVKGSLKGRRRVEYLANGSVQINW